MAVLTGRMQDPSKVQSSNEEWEKFAALMNAVLESFANITSLEIEDEADKHTYFSKYLTSPKVHSISYQICPIILTLVQCHAE